MWWTTQSWTSTCGNTETAASGNPVRPSPHRMRMSRTPRAFKSLRTFSQNRAPSVSSIHRPSTSCRPAMLTPSTVYTHLFRTPLSVRTATRSPSTYNRVDAVQRTILPVHNLLLDLISGTGDELRRNFHAVDFADVIFDLAGCHAPRIQRNNQIGKIADAGLAFGNHLRIEGAVSVTRRIDANFAEVTANGLGGMPIA